MRFTFEIAGDKLVERELTRFGDRAVNAAPAFSAIAGVMIEETAEQFATQGQHASGGWKPLKPSTLRTKELAGERPEILRATDALMRSLTVPTDPNMLLAIGPTELDYGSKLVYAGAHQNPKPTSNLPQRRPVEFTEAAKRRMVKILQRHLVEGAAV